MGTDSIRQSSPDEFLVTRRYKSAIRVAKLFTPVEHSRHSITQDRELTRTMGKNSAGTELIVTQGGGDDGHPRSDITYTPLPRPDSEETWRAPPTVRIYIFTYRELVSRPALATQTSYLWQGCFHYATIRGQYGKSIANSQIAGGSSQESFT